MLARRGFTLIELMVVVLIIGVLAAIAIPNYVRLSDHAKEAEVKNVVHVVQLSAEDYSVRNDGVYSDAAADLLPLMPGAALVVNPFTGLATEPQFAVAAATAGQVGIVALAQGGVNVGYTITGFGRSNEISRVTSGN